MAQQGVMRLARWTMAATMMAASWALGQAAPVGVLGPDVVRAQPLSAAQGQAVAAYVAQHSGNLTSTDRGLAARDRAAILAPLSDTQASTAFRLRYAEALEPRLREMAASADALVALNGLILAGELATTGSLDLLRDSLRAGSPDLRFQAATAHARAFEVIRTRPPAVLPPRQAQALRDLAARLPEEPDQLVAWATARALVAGSQLPGQSAGTLAALASGMTRRIDALAGNTPAETIVIETKLTALRGVREAFSAAQVAGQSPPEATVRAAAELGGAALAHVVRVTEAGTLPAPATAGAEPNARELYAQVAGEAETVLALAAQLLTQPNRPGARALADALRRGEVNADAQFGLDARLWVGPDGAMTRPPFGFARTRFLPR